MKENTSLKETLKTSASFYMNNNRSNISYCNTRDRSIDMSPIPNNVIDMSKIKKIEPKRGTLNQSNKGLSQMNVNNLNAQTASGQFSNQQGRGLLNVNINTNSNKGMASPYLNKNGDQISPNESNAYQKRKYY